MGHGGRRIHHRPRRREASYSLDGNTAPLRYIKESLVNPASPAAANGSVTEPRQSPSQPYGDVPSGTSRISRFQPRCSRFPLQARTDNYRSAASRFRSGEQLPQSPPHAISHDEESNPSSSRVS